MTKPLFSSIFLGFYSESSEISDPFLMPYKPLLGLMQLKMRQTILSFLRTIKSVVKVVSKKCVLIAYLKYCHKNDMNIVDSISIIY